jgi:hypothetical protein
MKPRWQRGNRIERACRVTGPYPKVSLTPYPFDDEAGMPFQCTQCGANRVEHTLVDRGSKTAVEIHCAGCRRVLDGPLTTAPVTFDDLLRELCREDAGDLSHYELAFLLARPDTQVLAALMDLRLAGLVRCLELDLEDYDGNDRDGHWVPAGNLDQLRTHAKAENSLDLFIDIGVSSSLDGLAHHRWVPGDLLSNWASSISFIAK